MALLIETGISPITQYGSHDTFLLARTYWASRHSTDRYDINHLSRSEARVVGSTEIKALTLSLLGQQHLLEDEAASNSIYPVQNINEIQVSFLAQLYRTVKTVCLSRYLDIRTWTTEGITPYEARIDSNARELSMVLITLGQDRLRTIIDRESANETTSQVRKS